MVRVDLLGYKHNVFSQNGEDGVISKIMSMIVLHDGVCCEFGAWDGIHLSNTRNLIMGGWRALMIESDPAKYEQLLKTYKENSRVVCVNRLVDDANNTLSNICKESDISNIDFLSVDIDGMDYEIFRTLDIYPKIICIEVNTGHAPDKDQLIDNDTAKNNVGQSLAVFTKTAKSKGYSLLCYTGNAFYIRDDIAIKHDIAPVSAVEAYTSLLRHLSTDAREWLYLLNLGLVEPYYTHKNRYLSGPSLGISKFRGLVLAVKNSKNYIKHLLNGITSTV